MCFRVAPDLQGGQPARNRTSGNGTAQRTQGASIRPDSGPVPEMLYAKDELDAMATLLTPLQLKMWEARCDPPGSSQEW